MSSQAPFPGYVVSSGALVSPGGAQGPGGATDSAMVGAIQLYSSTSPPPGWMNCDGSAISRSTFAALYNLIGTTFGAGDGVTTFNIPDLRSRVAVGVGQGSGLTNRMLAAIGGEETHVLLIAELAAHSHTDSGHAHTSHTVSHTHNDAGHTHSYATITGAGSSLAAGSAYNVAITATSGSGFAQLSTTGDIGTTTSTNSAALTNTGSGVGHNTMPPFLALVYMIKVSATVSVGATLPLADTTQSGLLTKVSGLVTDYVGGDNTCHALPAVVFPTGMVTDFAGSSAPTGWLICDGSAVSRTTYVALYTVIGTTFGTGDGSTTFNLPNARGRTAIGAGQGSGLTNRLLAATGGEETHQLTIAELASHTHVQTAHNHTFPYAAINLASGAAATLPNVGGGAGGPYGGTTSVAAVNQNAGSDTAHNTMPPFLVLNKIIKT